MKPLALIATLFLSTIAAAPALAHGHRSPAEVCMNERGQYENSDVISACSSLIRPGADHLADAHFNRAIAYGDSGDMAAAITDLTEVLRLEPDNVFALESRAQAYRANDQLDEAIADLEALAKLRPDDAGAFYNLGNAHAAKSDYDGAIAAYDKAIQINPDYAQAYNNRGSAHHMLRQYDAALSDFNMALELEPGYASGLANRCRVRAVLKQDLEKALGDCSAALEQRPQDSLTYDTRGLINLLRMDYPAAYSDYDAAYELNARQYGSLFGRGVAQLRLGRKAAGQADIDAAVAGDPNVPGLYERSGIKP